MTDEIEARRAAPRTSYASALTRAYQDGRRILFSLPCYHMFGYVEGLLSVMFVGGAVIPGRRHRAPRPSSAAASLSRMSNPRYSESVVVGRPPEDLYDMVADVTRMGEWSPICKACWWDDGDGPRPGAWFTGRNELAERTWETRSQVVAADRGREFAFVVGGAWVRWGYTFTPVDGGTQVTLAAIKQAAEAGS